MRQEFEYSHNNTCHSNDRSDIPFNKRTFHHMYFRSKSFFNICNLLFSRKSIQIKTSTLFQNIDNSFSLIFFKTCTLNLFYKFMGIKTLHFVYSHVSPLKKNIALICINCYIFGILTIPYTAKAFKFTEEICAKYGLGANWYCESAKEGESTELSANDILHSSIPAEQKAIELNQLWDLQAKRATITGAKKDIEAFLTTHYLITSKGIDFSRNAQRIIESSPNLFNPESYYKNAVNSQIKQAEIKEILSGASKRYGLVMVYSASCHHCGRQLPITLGFGKEYGFSVLGITTESNSFPGFDENIVDESITSDPMVQAYPTILLLDRKRPAKIFVSNGLTTFDELEERVAAKIIERESNEVNHE